MCLIIDPRTKPEILRELRPFLKPLELHCARGASPPGPLSHRPPATRERGGG